MKAQTFLTASGSRLIFTSDAWKALLRYRQTQAAAREAGGVLLGRHLLDSDDVAVDSLTTPQSSDRRSRTRFFRSRRHAALALREWEASKGTQDYLGLWHSHSESVPTPSWVDVWDWKRAVKKGKFSGSGLFFVIVGTDMVKVWELPRNGTLVPLKNE